MNKYALLVSMVLLSSPISAQHLVLPCEYQGNCTMCGTASCNKCGKFSKEHSSFFEQKKGRCAGCDDSSICCTTTNDARKVDDRTADNFQSGCSVPHSSFIPRSQGTDTSRELVGWEEFIHQFNVGDYYLTTGHVIGYYRSFRPERIAQEIFGDTVLRFAGSQVPDRGACELLADNFGLSANFRGSLSCNPFIENIVVDNQFFIGLDPLACGLYMRFHLPLVHTRWDLRLCETSTTEVCSAFQECYMSENEAEATCCLLDAVSGCFTFGDMQEPWEYGRIINGVQTKTALADIDFILGYDFKQADTHHVGFYGQLVLPTGNTFTARTLFEPMVGNARHVELGVGFSAHVIMYEHTADSSFALWVEGNAVHMFKNSQMRSFDFCLNGPLSRYMLLKELDENNAYTGKLINAINFATRPVDVSIAIKGDISAKFAVRTPRIVADLGYNFYGRTKEHVCLKSDSSDKNYVIKGSEGVCGLEYATQGDVPPRQFGPSSIRKVPLNSSQSMASIKAGSLTDYQEDPEKLNLSDIIVTAYSVQSGSVENLGVIRAKDSAPPVKVTVKDLNIASGELPSQATHKVFGYLGYNCFDMDWCCNPYLGLGGEIEFDALTSDEYSALNQWSVFLKGGFEF